MPSCKCHLLRTPPKARPKLGKNADGLEKWFFRNGFEKCLHSEMLDIMTNTDVLVFDILSKIIFRGFNKDSNL